MVLQNTFIVGIINKYEESGIKKIGPNSIHLSSTDTAVPMGCVLHSEVVDSDRGLLEVSSKLALIASQAGL